MRNFKLVNFAMLSMFLTACSSVPFTSEVELFEREEMAVLTDYELKDGFITIKAVGHGCTFFDSFRVEVADKTDNSIKVVRTRPDECGMNTRNVSLQYSFKHLGLDLEKEVQVNNPVNKHADSLSKVN